jgi:hypothetical protein
MDYQSNYQKQARIMYADSRNRISGTSSNFTIGLSLPTNEWDSVALMQASIPKSWYLISATLGNNTFQYKEGAGAYVTLTVPNGSYNKVSMVVVLKTLLQSVTTFGVNAFTISYPNNQIQADTFKYTFSSNNAIVSSMLFSNNLSNILGFPQGVHTFSIVPTTAPNAYNFASITRLFIVSNLASYADGQILQEVFQSQPDQSIVYYNQLEILANAKLFSANSDDIFTFVIQDRYGNVVDLNGVDWVASLYFFRKDDTGEYIKNDILVRHLTE